MPPEAEAFFVNLDFQRRKFVTFDPERVGSPTKIWKYIIAKVVRGLKKRQFVAFNPKTFFNLLEIYYIKGG